MSIIPLRELNSKTGVNQGHTEGDPKGQSKKRDSKGQQEDSYFTSSLSTFIVPFLGLLMALEEIEIQLV